MTNSDVRDFLADPRESLDLELKQWLDPTKPEGIAKIAKGCMALRNNDGGRLIIGLMDNGKPDLAKPPGDIRDEFHVDVIQAIVSKYSFEPFPIEVKFEEIRSQNCPVIIVPPGVTTPVAAKATLDGFDGKPLIRDHAIYVRSLTSNNTFEFF